MKTTTLNALIFWSVAIIAIFLIVAFTPQQFR